MTAHSRSVIEPLEPRRFLAAQLFADLTESGNNPGSFHPFGSSVVFAADHPEQGRELWISDGTTAGTRVVADIVAGIEGSNPIPLFSTAKYLYFYAAGGWPKNGLWRTDGTAAGTIFLTEQVDSSIASDTGGFYSFAEVGDKVFFTKVDYGIHEAQLYCDTPIGLKFVRGSFRSDWLPREIAALGSKAILAVDTPYGPQLWESDGTTASAIKFKANIIAHLRTSGGQMYFAADTPNGRGLWKLRRDNKAVFVYRCNDLQVLQQNQLSSAFWFGSEDATDGVTSQIWRLDLTGIHQVTSFPAGGGLVSSSNINIGADGIFFSNLHELWFCGNNDAAARKIAALPDPRPTKGGAQAITAIVGTRDALFVKVQDKVGANLYRSIPYTGTPKLIGGVPLDSEIVASDQNVLFAQADAAGFNELFGINATQATPQQITDTTGGVADSEVANLVPFKGGLLFNTHRYNSGDYWYEYQHSIWFTDGTSPPRLVKRLLHHDSYHPTNPTTAIATPNYVYFSLFDGPDEEHTHWELWRTDATEAGTIRITTLPPDPDFLGTIGSKIILRSYDATQQAYVIWVSDGTAAGTKQLKSLPFVEEPSYPPPMSQEAVTFDGKLYFLLYGKVYRTDGTAAGTIDFTPKLQLTSGRTNYISKLALRKDKLLIAGTEFDWNGYAAVWQLSAGAATATRILQAPVGQSYADLICIPATDQYWLQITDEFAYEGRPDLYIVPTSATSSPAKVNLQVPGHFTELLGYAAGNYYITTSKEGVVKMYALDNSLARPRQIVGEGMDDVSGLSFTAYSMSDALILMRETYDNASIVRLTGSLMTPVLADDVPTHEYETNFPPIPRFTPVGDKLFFLAADSLHGVELWSYKFEESIAGIVFNDANANGIRDIGETGLVGRQVFIDANFNGYLDAGEYLTVTSKTGRYQFNDLLPGVYFVTVPVPVGPAMVYGAKVVAGAIKTKYFGIR